MRNRGHWQWMKERVLSKIHRSIIHLNRKILKFVGKYTFIISNSQHLI